jgi:spore maturation protein CgeB
VNLGLYIRWPAGSLARPGRNTLGDELLSLSLCRELAQLPGVASCRLYSPDSPPETRLDALVYMNETPPRAAWARRHVRYMQNFYDRGSDLMLRDSYRWPYDGYAFVSEKLLAMHRRGGRDGLFLPFGADTALFRPVPPEPAYAFDAAYVGNDIKGGRTADFICPALAFNFGLYGNWDPSHGWKLWKYLRPAPPHRASLKKIARGKIPQEKVPALYSSSAVVLNCTAADAAAWDVISHRALEALACGAFLITDRVPAAERELAGCAVFTDGGADLADKLRFYLARPAERAAIAGRGRAYVLEKAPLALRARALLDYLGGLA